MENENVKTATIVKTAPVSIRITTWIVPSENCVIIRLGTVVFSLRPVGAVVVIVRALVVRAVIVVIVLSAENVTVTGVMGVTGAMGAVGAVGAVGVMGAVSVMGLESGS